MTARRVRTVVRRPRHAVAERPFIVIWEATRACPPACLHCRAEAVTARHPDELDGADALLRGRCGACEFKAVCGGSRSRAYGFTGDVLESDPYCAYEPGSFPYRDELRSLTESTRCGPRRPYGA